MIFLFYLHKGGYDNGSNKLAKSSKFKGSI